MRRSRQDDDDDYEPVRLGTNLSWIFFFFYTVPGTFSVYLFGFKIVHIQEPRRRRTYTGVLAIPHVVRPVEEITQAELDNICTNVREKVYNRATVSCLHGCSLYVHLHHFVFFFGSVLKHLDLKFGLSYRAAHVTSVVRRQQTPRLIAVTLSVLGSEVSFVAHACGTVMERKFTMRFWTQYVHALNS